MRRRFAIDADEADALVASAQRAFRRRRPAFLAPQPDRWYLRLDAAPAHARPRRSPRRAAQSIDPLLPRGPDARAWHARLNEAADAAARATRSTTRAKARGAPPVNSVWLWGGGTLPAAAPRRSIARVRASDPVALGLAQALGRRDATRRGDARAWLADAPATASTAILLDALRVPAAYGDAYEWRDARSQRSNATGSRRCSTRCAPAASAC